MPCLEYIVYQNTWWCPSGGSIAVGCAAGLSRALPGWPQVGARPPSGSGVSGRKGGRSSEQWQEFFIHLDCRTAEMPKIK